MKVELQNGDRIQIPEGCRAQINGNEVVVEKEEKSEDFKRGDILVSLSNEIILVDDYVFEGGGIFIVSLTLTCMGSYIRNRIFSGTNGTIGVLPPKKKSSFYSIR